MQKIISLFKRLRDADPVRGRLVYNEVTEGAEWVIQGEGIATRKWDGVAVLIKDAEVFMRFDFKQGRQMPEGFIPAQEAPDPRTGHWPGWVPANTPSGKWVMKAVEKALMESGSIPDGTYEACGPKIGTRHGSNPEKLSEHILIPHGKEVLEDAPRNYEDLKAYLQSRSIEGIVWHHSDGRMVKIKKADFPL